MWLREVWVVAARGVGCGCTTCGLWRPDVRRTAAGNRTPQLRSSRATGFEARRWGASHLNQRRSVGAACFRWLGCDERQRGASKPPGLPGGLRWAQWGAAGPLVSRLGAGAPRTSTSGGGDDMRAATTLRPAPHRPPAVGAGRKVFSLGRPPRPGAPNRSPARSSRYPSLRRLIPPWRPSDVMGAGEVYLLKRVYVAIRSMRPLVLLSLPPCCIQRQPRPNQR